MTHDDVGDGMTQKSHVAFCSNKIQTQKGSNEGLFILKRTHCKILFQIFVLINSVLLNLFMCLKTGQPRDEHPNWLVSDQGNRCPARVTTVCVYGRGGWTPE